VFNWFAKKIKQDKIDHPLGSDEAIDAFLDELKNGRPETNLHEISDWLGDPEALASALPPELFQNAVMRLDQAAQGYISTVWEQFLAENKIDHIGEQKLKALEVIYTAITRADRIALQSLLQRAAPGEANLGSTAGILAQRALRAHVAKARILQMRYRQPDAAWWTTVAELLAVARRAGALNLKYRCYANDDMPSSPWLETLLGFFFTVAPLGNCNPPQMDLLFRLLRWLEPHFMVSENYGRQATYFVHLERLAAPKKVIGPLPPDPNNVYFGPGLAYGHLVRLRTSLKGAETLPPWMASSQCTPELAMAIIDALIMHWSERPPTRVARRENRAAQIRSINGFQQIRRMIAFSEFARSGRKIGYTSHFEMLKHERRGFADTTADTEESRMRWQNASPIETLQILETSGDKQLMDEWTMLDISETGVGALAPFLKPWMIIGAYVGYRLEDEIDWRIGILRRIHRKESGHPSLGIEALPETPLCAQVRELRVPPGGSPANELAREASGQSYDDAIVVSQEKSHVLVPKDLFAADAFLALSVGGHREAVRMVSLVHSNADCDCVEYATLD
jgi:cyclic-di-GMP-binding protein